MPRNNNWLGKDKPLYLPQTWLRENVSWYIDGCDCQYCVYICNLQNQTYKDVAGYILSASGMSRDTVNELTKQQLVEWYYLDFRGVRPGSPDRTLEWGPVSQPCGYCDGTTHNQVMVGTSHTGHTLHSCRNCLDGLLICRYCNKHGSRDNPNDLLIPPPNTQGIMTVCEECSASETYTYTCDECGCCMDEAYDEVTSTEDECVYCYYCGEDHTFFCQNCDCLYSTEHTDTGSTTSGHMCEHCMYDAEYCDECGYYCNDHIDCHCDAGIINRYSYKPEPIFHFAKIESNAVRRRNTKNRNRYSPVFFGVELETDFAISRDSPSYRKATKVVLDAFNKALREATGGASSKAFIYAKSDASVSGPEFVTHPFTYKWLLEHKDVWKEFFNTLEPNGFIADNSNHAGMHVHISRNAFTTLGLYKFMRFLYGNPFLSEKIAGRSNRNMQSYGSVYAETSQSIKERAKFKEGGNRGSAINCGNRHTFEIRMFQGVHTFDKFMHNMEFCQSMIEFVRSIGMTEISQEGYAKWLDSQGKKFRRILSTVQKPIV